MKEMIAGGELRNSRNTPNTATKTSARSSVTPNANAANDPMTAHNNGPTTKTFGRLADAMSNMPKVKIAVGHGNPNVGAAG